MRKAVIIIGCNWGDEGKGLATAYSAGKTGNKCLNVLINGGTQRGHTVETEDNKRHVFHHFGSAALNGARSCADEDFILNPLLFCQEREELVNCFHLDAPFTASAKCRVSTPYDMMLGQIIEENRGRARHGSCGCGILETRLRYENAQWALPWEKAAALSREEFLAYCRRIIKEYLPGRLAALHMRLPDTWQNLLENPGIAAHAWQDLQTMKQHTKTYTDFAAMAAPYPLILFEAGQGLALDEDNRKDFPHLTPSHTTSLTAARRIASLEGETETEILYVTRSYFTRHGAGPLPTECPKEDINPDMEDRTNLPNPHQQTLRYGFFDGDALLERVRSDSENSKGILPRLRTAILVTHLNETGGKLAGAMSLDRLTAAFDRSLFSFSPWQVETTTPSIS